MVFKELLSIIAVSLCSGGIKDRLLSFEKPTKQESMSWRGFSWVAVDGNNDSVFFNGSCTHSDETGLEWEGQVRYKWWRVDLGQYYNVSYITVFNRVEVPQRLVDVVGTVEGKPCLPFPIGVSEMMVNLTCNTVGRVITFYKRVLTMQYGNILTLCEVEVYGHDTEIQNKKYSVYEIDWLVDAETGALLAKDKESQDWGTVCGVWITRRAADLVCQQLGFDVAYHFSTDIYARTDRRIAFIHHISCPTEEDMDCVFEAGIYNDTNHCMINGTLYATSIICTFTTSAKNPIVASSFRTINGFVHEESLTKHSSVAYTCPAQTSKSWEILHKFTCRDIFKEFTTTETCYLLSQRCDLANLQFCGLDPDIKYEGGSCGFICPTKFGEHTVLPNMVRCNGMTNCIDNSDEANCNTLGAESGLIACYYDENILVPTSSPPYCDESYYECGGGYHFKDEIDCNHETGKFVTTALPPKLAFWWAHPNYVCNSDTKFYMGEDCFDTSNGGINCTQIGRQATIYVPPFRMCTNPVISRNTPNDFRLCEGWREQMNCPVNKKNIALQCNVEGVDPNTKLTKYLVCNRGVSCTDGLDEKCETVTHNCRIHRHKICDGVRDCDFGEDEYRCDAFFTTVLCVRRLQGEFDVPYRFPILRTWVMDGVEDCLEGEDENLENWNKCAYTYMDPRMRKMVGTTDYIDSQEKCKNYYIPKRSTELIALDQLCDNIESFVGETELCRISRNLTGISSNFVHGDDIISVAPCVLGLDRNIKSMYNCELFTNNFDVGIWGLPQKSWFIEKRQKECKFLYAARYVMTSCLGLCIENITCPIKLLPTTACSKNPQNSATAVNLLSRYDTKRGDGVKLRIMKDRNYANDFFQCSNGRCVPFEKICNLADDCGDESDEKDCYNQYICKNSSERISLDKVCDKKVHCGDFSDECNERCSMRVIQSSHLRNYGWFIGVSSTFINFLVIIKSSDRLYNLEKHRSYFRDTLLVTLIAFGDLMVGVYLLLISIADNIIGNKYCFQRFEWLGSIHCKLLGILSTVGSQVSLFTMATLSVYRVYTIKNVMGSNFIGFHSKLVCSLIIILIILTSLIMSIAPIISVFEDYFINGLYYNDNTLFRGMVNKRAHASILQAHFGSANSGILETFSWKKIRGLVEQMFTKEPKNVKGTGIGFYGNAGVCLFKYFVKASDPQRAFSLATLFVNFLCFIIITFAYISVMVLTMFSSVSSSRSSYNKSLQRKISLIILSDAICWIPFIILGALNYLDVIDADEYYEFCSIVILPTNSLINPLIYHFNISRCHHKLTTIISTIRTTIMETSRANRTESHMKVSSAIRNEAAIQEAEQPTPSFYNVAEAEM